MTSLSTKDVELDDISGHMGGKEEDETTGLLISGTMDGGNDDDATGSGGLSSVITTTTSSSHETTSIFTAAHLDEPVSKTLMRDLKRVGSKLVVVVDPRRLLKFRPSEEEIRHNNEIIRKELVNWDLWGPLLICTILGITQSWSAPEDQKSLVFSSVFFIVWGGGAILTVNAQLLGTPLSFLQSICLIGYSVFPIALAALVCQASGSIALRIPSSIVANLWSIRVSALFLSSVAKADRKELVIFPVILFYAILTWMVFLE